MNKFYTLLTLALLTASYTATTLPMNRLARVAAKAPKLAPKITPTLAAPQRRLLSTTSKIASLPNPYLHKRFDVIQQPNFKQEKQQRTFARPYPWLPALGAAAAFGLNWQREKAECLTVGTDVVPLDKDTVFIFIEDLHWDELHKHEGLQHAQDILRLSDYLETLEGHRIIWFSEIGENSEESVLRSYRAATSNAANAVTSGRMTLDMATARAILSKDKASNITCEDFDLRKGQENTIMVLAKDMNPISKYTPKAQLLFMIKKHQEFGEKNLKDALAIVQKSSLQPSLKNAARNAIQDHYYELDPSHDILTKLLKQEPSSDTYPQLPMRQLTAIGSIPSEANLLVRALEEVKKPGKKVIVIHSGAKHIEHFKTMAYNVNMLPTRHKSPFDLKKYNALSLAQQKQCFINDYAQRIITEIESWRKQQEQSPGKPD